MIKQPLRGRVILHVDMNSFFASVEMAFNPQLKGKPLAIAGKALERKGIIVTCSYEARKYGVKTTMLLWEAKKLCPHLIVMTPNFERYKAASQKIFTIFRQYTPLVEPVSIDEGYIDLTDYYGEENPVHIAERIQQQLLNELDLPCSIGIAPNKFLAKMASDMEKPLGITILRKREIYSKLWPLPVIDMHGVGKKTAKKLHAVQIETIGDLAKADPVKLRGILGIRGVQLIEKANGIDERKVDPEAAEEFKSVGNSTTLPNDNDNQSELNLVFKTLSEKVAKRLKDKGYVSQHVAITIRYADRKTITRGITIDNPIQLSNDIFIEARALFIEHWNGMPVRLLGITCQELLRKDQAFEQLDLFTYEKKAAVDEPLFQAMDKIIQKYGETSIRRGINSLTSPKKHNHTQDES